jgi:hypothetical protein
LNKDPKAEKVGHERDSETRVLMLPQYR